MDGVNETTTCPSANDGRCDEPLHCLPLVSQLAPTIAEALFATALGLVAAIPAVIFYNKLSADADRIISGYEAFADEFSTILSRQLDA